MKLQCAKNELSSALQIVSKAVAVKPQTPILSGIYLKASDNQLELQATNYEIGIIVRIDAEIEEPGEIAISGRYFGEVIRRLPGEKVALTFSRDENILHIQSNQANFTLVSMNPAEFPTVKELSGDLQFTIKDNVLRSLIKKTVFACATDEGRPVFTGCSLDIQETKVTMAATNTHRLAVKSETFNQSIGKIKIIVPSRTLSELLHNMTSEIPTDVTVTCSYNRISFKFDNFFMTSRLIEGQFPDYNRVIPSAFETHVKLDTAAFSGAVDRVSLISRSGEYNVIKLEFANDTLHITSNNPDIGKAEETIAAEIQGPDLTIAFNSQYIIDVLKAIETKVCRLDLGKALTPIAVREENEESFIYIVTPVRTQH